MPLICFLIHITAMNKVGDSPLSVTVLLTLTCVSVTVLEIVRVE